MRGRGRPAVDQESVSPARILAQALVLLDNEGLEGLTMRALAKSVGINPMTIYHHFQDRDGLIKSLADTVYSDVVAPAGGSARSQIEGLLNAYRAKVVAHPALTLAIFSRPAVFPFHAKRITESLADLLGELGLSSSRSWLWVNILVDFTHGAALAVAMHEKGDMPPQGSGGVTDTSYEQAVAELLGCL